jgi:hypothetical protein
LIDVGKKPSCWGFPLKRSQEETELISFEIRSELRVTKEIMIAWLAIR